MLVVIDNYNPNKRYIIEFKGGHYVIQQFVLFNKHSKKLRLGIKKIAEILQMSKQIIRRLLRGV